ncbi:MAG TPA: YggS family pyridoxal phosphate-dependent enzyme [Bacillales bacterium]|nr:YggS family pyridoxal phosphate-dependent enzyme [Bacillales bacterium]
MLTIVTANLREIQSKINDACQRSGRRSEDVHIIAVTKYVSVETAGETVRAGIRHLGESRDSGFLEKRKAIGDEATWHFIGTLQSRKVKNVIGGVDYIHSLDRMSLAKEIEKRAGRVVDCFVQVNAAGERTKHGLSVGETISFVEQLSRFSSIRVVGLMTMAPLTDNEEEIRAVFRKVNALKDEICAKQWDHAPCTELSMGMSNDFAIAVEEGATFVRIGTALVGKEF